MRIFGENGRHQTRIVVGDRLAPNGNGRLK